MSQHQKALVFGAALVLVVPLITWAQEQAQDDGVVAGPPPNEDRCIAANVSVTKREAFCRSIPIWRSYVRGGCWQRTLTGGEDWNNWCRSVDW